MRILNIAYDDYANLAFDNARALQAAGIEAKAVKRTRHPFNYQDTAPVVSSTTLLHMVKDYDIIQLFHSWSWELEELVKMGKRLVVWHTGTTYRINPGIHNDIFNPVVELCITDQTEFMHLGGKNIQYMATAVEETPPPRILERPFKIGHYPSNRTVKGSDKIDLMVKTVIGAGSLDHKYLTGPPIAHSYNLERMRECCIYIELFANTHMGREYGCYGVTAFEAAAQGCLVFTQNLHPEVYEQAYGLCPFVITNTEHTFAMHLEWCLSSSEEELYKKMYKSWELIMKNHSMKATGERMKKILGI